MNKPLTQQEWQQSVAEAFSSAVESTYKDMIEKAVAEEREACADILDRNADACASNSMLRDVLIGNALAIRARGNHGQA